MGMAADMLRWKYTNERILCIQASKTDLWKIPRPRLVIAKLRACMWKAAMQRVLFIKHLLFRNAIRLISQLCNKADILQSLQSSTMATSTTPGVYINSKGKKTFVPLENNPAVFDELGERLGLSSSKVGFYDVYSLDDPDLLSTVPRPVHALIFIVPGPVYRETRTAYDGYDGDQKITYNKSGKDEPIIWFKQTIGK